MVPEVRDQVTTVRNGSVFPWPLNHYQNWRKRRHFELLLELFDWRDMTLKEVMERVLRCCESLKLLLGSKAYFFGDT